MPKRYPEEFRRKVLDRVTASRPIAQIAADLSISDQTVYGRRKQELIDTGQLPGINHAGRACRNEQPYPNRLRGIRIEVSRVVRRPACLITIQTKPLTQSMRHARLELHHP